VRYREGEEGDNEVRVERGGRVVGEEEKVSSEEEEKRRREKAKSIEKVKGKGEIEGVSAESRE